MPGDYFRVLLPSQSPRETRGERCVAVVFSLEERLDVLAHILVVQFAVQSVVELGHNLVLVWSLVLFDLLWGNNCNYHMSCIATQ